MHGCSGLPLVTVENQTGWHWSQSAARPQAADPEAFPELLVQKLELLESQKQRLFNRASRYGPYGSTSRASTLL